MKSLRRLGLSLLAVITAGGIAYGAADLTLSTGTQFTPGPRLIDGADLNVLLGAVNKLNDQIDGTKPLPLCTGSGATPITCNGSGGKVTTVSLTTAALTDAADIVINNTSVAATSSIQCSINGYSGVYGTNGDPILMACIAGASTITLKIRNTHATVALNGTLSIGFRVVN